MKTEKLDDELLSSSILELDDEEYRSATYKKITGYAEERVAKLRVQGDNPKLTDIENAQRVGAINEWKRFLRKANEEPLVIPESTLTRVEYI